MTRYFGAYIENNIRSMAIDQMNFGGVFMKKFLTLVGIVSIIIYLVGCGAMSENGENLTESGNLSIEIAGGRSYPAVSYYKAEVLDPSTNQSLIDPVIVSAPTSRITINDVPVGRRLIRIGEFDANGNQIGYGHTVVNIGVGTNSGARVDILHECDYWLVVHPIYSRWRISSTPTEEKNVSMNMISLKRWSGNLTVTVPTGVDYTMGDLGPGGSIYVRNYSYGNPPTEIGETTLSGRGNGSFFEARALLGDTQVAGDYIFNGISSSGNAGISGIQGENSSSTVICNAGYSDIPTILEPEAFSAHPLTSDITVTWQDLGMGYKYLCEAFHKDTSSGGTFIYTHCWASKDARDMSFAYMNMMKNFIETLSSETTAVIPAGTFPVGTHDIYIRVWAFPTSQIDINPFQRSVNPFATIGSAVIPTGLYSIV
ncbi:MAG: hypothetical protein J7M18_02440, partial [Candidatus Eremiobacteraeota bacterium]|nr:hypothetical protein [Candidatus Eremiobacteraeota bacterium]